MKDWMDAMENLVWLTQLGVSVLVPPVCLTWLCSWLVNTKGAPLWLYAVFIPLGLACGGMSFWNFCKMVLQKAKRHKEEKQQFYFNKHS